MLAGMKRDIVDPDVHRYAVEHTSPADPLLAELAARTAADFPESAIMQIGPEQGVFMNLLAASIGARRVLEVGTYTGYSTICLARGTATGGRLISCDVSAEWSAIAAKFLARAGVSDRVELRLGPALDTIAALPDDEPLDLAFIDADKPNYIAYWEAIVPRLRPGGLLLVDNTLFFGLVVDETNQHANPRAIRAFNDHARADPRVQLTVLTIGDGLTLARRLDRDGT